jgi:hypothetical protein
VGAGYARGRILVALLHKDVVEYDRLFPNPKGQARPCPRCKGGEGSSDLAKKKKLPTIKDILCFTCWGYTRKDGIKKSGVVSPKIKTLISRAKRKGRRATIRRSR